MPIYKMTDKNGKNIKKDGLQKYRVRINYTDSYGKAKQLDRIAYGKDQATQLETQLNNKLSNNEFESNITIEQLFNEYMIAKKHETRTTTYEKSRRILQRYVISDFVNTKTAKLSVQMIQKWKNSVSELGLSVTTCKNIYGEFRALLNYAVKMEYIKKNPLLIAGNFKSSIEPVKEMQYYTPEQFKQFINSARDFAKQSEEKSAAYYEWNYYVFFYIAFFTGMRKGEINALTWNDIKGGVISITKSVSQKAKGKDVITPPKNKSSIRTITIPKPLQNILDEHYQRSKSVINTFNDDMYICGGIKPIRDTTLENRNILYANMAGLPHIRIHDFRHSHASLLANEGINIQEIARRLGHSDISMTWNKYSHLYPREEERAVRVLNKIV